jgi:hypothetical protein
MCHISMIWRILLLLLCFRQPATKVNHTLVWSIWGKTRINVNVDVHISRSWWYVVLVISIVILL